MQMTGGNRKSFWCAVRSATINPPLTSRSVQLESHPEGTRPENWPARFGAGDKRSAGGGLCKALPIATKVHYTDSGSSSGCVGLTPCK